MTRFPDKAAHTVWLEPEGYDSDLIYPNGLSCSMPEDVQEILYRSVPGLENAKLVRPAYGVEYDHIDARELGRGSPFGDLVASVDSLYSDAGDEAHQGIYARHYLVPI